MKKKMSNRVRTYKKLMPLLLFIILSSVYFAQTVEGKIVDELGNELPNLNLNLYVEGELYSTSTLEDGSFTFNDLNITGVSDDELPNGYVISNNYPNPFNPKTRIGVVLPKSSSVEINVFNTLGQSVNKTVNEFLPAGSHFFDIELNHLPNGVYFARIVIDEQYIAIRKMMLLYGSQHLDEGSGYSMMSSSQFKNNAVQFSERIDSLVVSNKIVGKKTFYNLTDITQSYVNLGTLQFERYDPEQPTIEYEGKIYNTIVIGDQVWLRENLDVGTLIDTRDEMSNNGIVEKYYYNDDILNGKKYGAFYTWQEAMRYSGGEGAQGICPEGWHIPTVEEFDELIETVDGNGNLLKAFGEGSTALGLGTNESGFTGYLAGRVSEFGNSNNFGSNAYFWTSTEALKNQMSSFMQIHGHNNAVTIGIIEQNTAFSIRCIKD